MEPPNKKQLDLGFGIMGAMSAAGRKAALEGFPDWQKRSWSYLSEVTKKMKEIQLILDDVRTLVNEAADHLAEMEGRVARAEAAAKKEG